MDARICLGCGQAFNPANSKQRYCSVACGAAARKRRNHEERICLQCGQPFSFLLSAAHGADRQHFGRYCSHACAMAARRQGTTQVCPTCGTTFTAPPSKRQKYCSAACYGRAPKKAALTCRICGAPFEVTPSKVGQRMTCSRACRAKLDALLRTKDPSERKRRLSRRSWKTLRLDIIERDGGRCTRCGSTEHLHVHHIVAWHPGMVEDPANLITLCRSCHKKVDGVQRRKQAPATSS